MKHIMFLSMFLISSFTVNAQDMGARRFCAKASTETIIKDPEAFLAQNGIQSITNIQQDNLARFINHYLKIPAIFRKLLIREGSITRIMEGMNVRVDKTFSVGETHDGRLWSTVPAAGGKPGASSPTRFAVDSLYSGHGVIDLVLHEYGHTLSDIKLGQNLANSPEWMKIMRVKSVQNYLNRFCGTYCSRDNREGFAELFATYYACENSRKDVQEFMPEVEKYFSDLEVELPKSMPAEDEE